MPTPLDPFPTIVNQTTLEPADGRPNLDYFHSILLKFEALCGHFERERTTCWWRHVITYMQWWHHTVSIWWVEILADYSQNRQSSKINSPPKFPAIWYLLYISGVYGKQYWTHTVHSPCAVALMTSKYSSVMCICINAVLHLGSHLRHSPCEVSPWKTSSNTCGGNHGKLFSQLWQKAPLHFVTRAAWTSQQMTLYHVPLKASWVEFIFSRISWTILIISR